MAYDPTPRPGGIADIPGHGLGGEPSKPPRVWKGVATLAAMFVLVGAVTGAGVLESDHLHAMPISGSATAPAAGPSPVPSRSPDQPGRD